VSFTLSEKLAKLAQIVPVSYSVSQLKITDMYTLTEIDLQLI